MVHAFFLVDCTEMCVGIACTQPSYNDKKSIKFLLRSCSWKKESVPTIRVPVAPPEEVSVKFY